MGYCSLAILGAMQMVACRHSCCQRRLGRDLPALVREGEP
jgi:hypothetical protein